MKRIPVLFSMELNSLYMFYTDIYILQKKKKENSIVIVVSGRTNEFLVYMILDILLNFILFCFQKHKLG